MGFSHENNHFPWFARWDVLIRVVDHQEVGTIEQDFPVNRTVWSRLGCVLCAGGGRERIVVSVCNIIAKPAPTAIFQMNSALRVCVVRVYVNRFAGFRFMEGARWSRGCTQGVSRQLTAVTCCGGGERDRFAVFGHVS